MKYFLYKAGEISKTFLAWATFQELFPSKIQKNTNLVLIAFSISKTTLK